MKKILPSFIVLVLASSIIFLTKFNGLYGQDAHEYYRYSKALLSFFETGKNPGDYFWPVWYPLLGACISFVTHINVLLTLQIVSVFSLAVIVWVVAAWKHVSQKNQKIQLAFALIAVGFSPFILREGIVCMSDTLSIALVLLALYSAQNFLIAENTSWLFGFAAFAALAFMTRYATAVILFPFSLLIAYHLFLKKEFLKFIPVIVIVAVIFLPHFLIRLDAPIAFVHHEWLKEWSVSNFFKREFTTHDGTTYYLLPNFIFVFVNVIHPSFWVLGIPLLFCVKREDFSGLIPKVFLISVLLYAFFLAGIPFQNKRFLLMSFPLIVILFYPAFVRLLRSTNKKNAVYSLVILLHLILFVSSFKEFYQRNSLEKNLSALVAQYPDSVLYSFDIDVAIKSYGTTKTIENLWQRKFEEFQTPAMVLFNETKFQTQWRNKNPMLNWNEIKKSYNLEPLAIRKDGWELFRIVSKK